MGFQKPTGFNQSMYLTISQNMASYDLFYKSIIQTFFWKEMYQKSKMDTTIDFVKTPPNIQESMISWTFFLFQKKSEIGES